MECRRWITCYFTTLIYYCKVFLNKIYQSLGVYLQRYVLFSKNGDTFNFRHRIQFHPLVTMSSKSALFYFKLMQSITNFTISLAKLQNKNSRHSSATGKHAFWKITMLAPRALWSGGRHSLYLFIYLFLFAFLQKSTTGAI